MSKTYASLHNHSDYSNIKLIDSVNKVNDLIDNAYEKGFTAIALTDHDTVSGHVKAIQHFKENYSDKENFKLILGNEIYISKEDMSSETYAKGDKFYHLLLLALDEIGHKQIRQLSTRAWGRSFTKSILRTPTFITDLQDIVSNNQGHLVATTACLGSFTGTVFNVYGAKESKPMITEHLELLESIFGKGNLFIEVQPIMSKEQQTYNGFMVKNYWDKYPFIFTTDSHYLNKEDANIHKQFLSSSSGENREIDKYYSAAYLMTFDEIRAGITDVSNEQLEEMRLNTITIADRVKSYDLAHPQVVPTVPVEMTEDMKEYLETMKCMINIKYDYIHKYLNTDNIQDQYFINNILMGLHIKVKNINEEYYERLNYELEQVWETSVAIKQPLSKYFITMQRMIDIIWTEGDSLLGVSRGSAAGFLINYCLGITQIDPLTQALYLPPWRFIHKDRPGLPDIDIDTEGSKRTKVFNKIQQYFNSIGGDIVNVCTFGTEKAKSALRTAGRGLEIDDDTISYMVSMIPNERGFDWTLSQCMYGDEDHAAIKKFQDEMGKNRQLWTLASRIEGLISSVGVHASGIVALNEDITEYNSLMKTSRGALVTAFNLDDTEYAGGLKYDFLTVNGLDKIRTTLNLLLEDGMIDWVDNLRSTYDKYLLPINLDYTSKQMWEMVHNGQIVDLFQFDTPVGGQAIKHIKPKNIAELSVANTIMRLMSDDESELPLDTYVRFKNDNRAWYQELKQAGLNEKEVVVLEKYLKPLSGVADSQESVMLLTMDPGIANFTVTEANSLRKAIAKKKADVLDKTKIMFYEKGIKIGTSKHFLDYVWNVQIMRQAGYSFSVLHTMGYSTIALQEMNLAYRFPLIYWNTACLSVNAGAVNEEDYEVLIEDGIVELDDNDDDKRTASKVQYGKVAAAISRFRDNFDLTISLPDINLARFGFTPDALKNQVLFGLKGITRIGEDLIRTIIAKRPYNSLEDFLNKVNSEERKVISKDKVVMLIKAGAFDNIENRTRQEILKDFVLSVADQKKKLTISNIAMLINYNLIPEEYSFEQKIYNYTKYLRKNKYKDFYYILDDTAQDFYSENSYDSDKLSIVDGKTVIFQHDWDFIYNTYMDTLRVWLEKNESEILEQLNTILFNEEYEKYASGNVLTWELDSLNFYHSGHELTDIAKTFPMEVDSINDIPDREVIGHFNIRGKISPKYKIRHIIGTVLDKDKQKHLITLSTPEGIISVKVYRTQFSHYDQVNFQYNEDGEKEIIQDSFFRKGTFLLVTGIKDGELFIPKAYKEIGIDPVLRFEIEDGKFKKAYAKL